VVCAIERVFEHVIYACTIYSTMLRFCSKHGTFELVVYMYVVNLEHYSWCVSELGGTAKEYIIIWQI